VDVDKEETYNVDASETVTKSVTITVTNGNVAANVLVHAVIVSDLTDCDVRLVPAPGDTFSQYVTDEVAGPPSPDTRYTEIEFTVAMAAGETLVFTRDYTIHCTTPGLHTDAFELAVDALPVSPVAEEDLGLGQFPCGTPGHGPSDNVHKNCPDVTVELPTDLQKLGAVLTSSVTTEAGGTSFTITETSTIKNAGSNPANWSDESTLTLPADCTTPDPNPSTTTGGPLAGGAQTTTAHVWEVTCTLPSNHDFTSSDTVTLTGPDFTYDDPDDNNSATSNTVTVAITTTTDVSISVSCIAPASETAGTNFIIGCSGTTSADDTVGSTNPLGTPCGSPQTVNCLQITLIAPADCFWTSANANPLPPLSVIQFTIEWFEGLSVTGGAFGVTCTNGSNHSFTEIFELLPIYEEHVSEGDPGDESTMDTDVVGINKTGDPSCTSVTAPDGVVSNTGGPGLNLASSSDCQNGGLTSAVASDSAAGGPAPACAVSGGPGTYNVQLPSGTYCNYTVTYTICDTDTQPDAGHQCGLHDTDTDPSNNTASDIGTLCLDDDDDGVDDGGAPCNGPDNCPDDFNPGQEDADGDGIGDICDDTPDHDVGVKYCTLVGPAAVNISDDNGRYMWVLCEIGNFSDHIELVTISLAVTGPVPAGCSRTQALILPGQDQFVMGTLTEPTEQKFVVYRVRYECHSVTPQTLAQTATLSITHDDIDGPSGPHSGNDTNLSNQSFSVGKTIIIN